MKFAKHHKLLGNSNAENAEKNAEKKITMRSALAGRRGNRRARMSSYASLRFLCVLCASALNTQPQ
jgi:hypothetical protein